MKVLVARVTHIGDLILVTPVLRALHRAGCRVHVLAGRGNHAVLEAHPHVHRLWVFDKHRPGSLPGLFLSLRRAGFDAWLDPTDDPSTTSRLLARVGGAPLRVGCETGFRRPVFTHPIPAFWEDPGPHAVDRALRCLGPLGIEAAGRSPVLGRPPRAEDRVERFLRDQGLASYTLLNLSAGHPDRLWPVGRWLEWLARVLPGAGRMVLVHLPREAPVARAVLERFPQLVPAPTPSVQDVAALVRRARAVVTPDTALVHMASAFDVPTLALYVNRPEFYCRYLPLAPGSRAVIAPQPGAPVAAIPVEAVVEAWEAMAV